MLQQNKYGDLVLIEALDRSFGRMCPVIGAGLVAASLVSCSSSEPESPPLSGVGEVEVRDGQDAMLTSPDGGLSVDLDGGAVEGSGTLRVVEDVTPEGLAGWWIELEGDAELTGTATLRFSNEDIADDAPPPIVAFAAEPGGAMTVVDGVEMVDGEATVQVDHFSHWSVTWWDDLLESAREGIDQIYSAGAAGKQPNCSAEQDVRDEGFIVESDDGNRVLWCFGRNDADEPILRVVNGRGYTVAVESTPNLSIRDQGADDLVTAVASVVKGFPTKPDSSLTLLRPGSEIQFAVTGDGPAGVRVTPTLPGYLVTALQYGIDTLVMVLRWTGTEVSHTAILTALEIESCLASYSSMATTDIQNVTEAGNYLNDALGTVLGCAERAISRLGLGIVAAVIAQGIAWLISGIRTALNGIGAAADTALDPSGYAITISPPAKPALDQMVLSPEGLGGLQLGSDPSGWAADTEALVWDPTRCEEYGGEPGLWVANYPPLQSEEGSGFPPFAIDAWDDGKITRIDVHSPEIRTANGVGVGSSLDELRAAYGDDLISGVNSGYSSTWLVRGDRGMLVFEVPEPGNDDLWPAESVGQVIIARVIPIDGTDPGRTVAFSDDLAGGC